MVFNRLDAYKKEAQKLTKGYLDKLIDSKIKSIPFMSNECKRYFEGKENILTSLKDKFIESKSINDLVHLTKALCNKEKIYVSNNTLKIWPGEEGGEEIVDGKRLVWRIRPDDKYDPVLFSRLILEFEKSIKYNYLKIKKFVDEDIYLDQVENGLLRCIRFFNEDKASFSTLVNMGLNGIVINLANKYKKSIIYKDNKGNKIEEYITNYSLDSILENPKNSLYYDLPSYTPACMDILSELKTKYKKQNNLIAWSIVDWQLDDSELLQNNSFREIIKNKNRLKFNKNLFKEIDKQILQNDIYLNLGFNKPNLKSILEQNIKSEDKEKLYNQAYNREYKIALKNLQKDAVDYELV